MGTSSSKAGDAHSQSMCGFEWLCTPSGAAPLGGGDEDEFHSLEVHAKVKRRGQNVFAESVELGALPETKVTPAMKKGKGTRNVIRQALRKNFVFASFRAWYPCCFPSQRFRPWALASTWVKTRSTLVGHH